MRLSEAVALARAAKTRVHGALTVLHRESQKEQLFDGQSRTFEPKTENDDQLPSESKQVRLTARDVLEELRRLLVERWDSEGLVSANNQHASANVVLPDGSTLLEDVPATYLLFLEKSLEDFYTFVLKVPTLDSAEQWEWDASTSLYRAKPVKTAREKRVPKALVLYPATDKHPAQVTQYDDTTVAGYWTTTKLSGALPAEQKRDILLRIVEIRDAVKTARERANHHEVTDWKPAAALLNYALNGRIPRPTTTP